MAPQDKSDEQQKCRTPTLLVTKGEEDPLWRCAECKHGAKKSQKRMRKTSRATADKRTERGMTNVRQKREEQKQKPGEPTTDVRHVRTSASEKEKPTDVSTTAGQAREKRRELEKKKKKKREKMKKYGEAFRFSNLEAAGHERLDFGIHDDEE